jgi:hypothetical protein
MRGPRLDDPGELFQTFRSGDCGAGNPLNLATIQPQIITTSMIIGANRENTLQGPEKIRRGGNQVRIIRMDITREECRAELTGMMDNVQPARFWVSADGGCRDTSPRAGRVGGIHSLSLHAETLRCASSVCAAMRTAFRRACVHSRNWSSLAER